MTRRGFLGRAGAVTVGLLASGVRLLPASAATRTVTGSQPDGFTVPAGDVWTISGTVTTPKNVVVFGTLIMRAGSVLKFTTINEAAFVGGSATAPIASDVGLWVFGSGKLDIQGTSKVPWNRTGDDPSWGSDELKVTPVAGGSYACTSFVKGSIVPSADGRTAEVLNLTRDARIEGSGPTQRAHIFIRSTAPQTIKNCTIRYMGPRLRDNSSFVLGRYAMHFHLGGSGASGTVVENVVVRDFGSWGFVPHSSHGITFRGCIAYNGSDNAFTWDDGALTDNTLIEGCVAAELVPIPNFRGYRLAGFNLGRGTGNIVRGCVATANRGNQSASGFSWPEAANAAPNTWTFSNNVAHNNRRNGIFVWQNNSDAHVVTGFDAYANGAQGIEHGAYVNNYQYRDLVLERNPTAILLHSLSATATIGEVFERLIIDGKGVATHAFVATKHRTASTIPVVVRDTTITGHTGSAFVVDERANSGVGAGLYDFVRVTVDGADFEPSSVQLLTTVPGMRLRAQRRDGTAWQMDSNGVVTLINAFAP